LRNHTSRADASHVNDAGQASAKGAIGDIVAALLKALSIGLVQADALDPSAQ